MIPYKRSNELTISNMNDTVLVETRIGVSIVWDGRGFLEVSVPSRYKGENAFYSYYTVLSFNILQRLEFHATPGFYMRILCKI